MQQVTALYFSATLTTKKVTMAIAQSVANVLHMSVREIDVTTPLQRVQSIEFSPEDIVIFGVPVYIGRVPNLIAPYFKTIKGNGALGVPVVVYGNRAFDDGLIELRDIMNEDGFRCIAAAAFVGEHSFSRILGAGRPDVEDLNKAESFGVMVAERIERGEVEVELNVPGNPYPYAFYKASDTQGKKVDIRKVKPETDKTLCNNCGYCAEICPMGSIDKEDCSQITGICIKCGACIKRCPNGAKRFTDEGYISHMNVIVEHFKDVRHEPEIFM